ncbi:MAG: hypothetical protein CMD63_01235 [Gammaproteobacteria bacterium]|nr:hypothetical protein [Gammaproteobacteria bacterium]|tara:strand:- start:13079 stop:14956 length:1878 start_codon:yes stop_codon:yes gene_type:complete
MLKVHNWFLLILLSTSSLINSECHEEEKANSLEIKNGQMEVGENSVVKFESAITTEEKLELKNVEVTTCAESSVWSLGAENATFNESNRNLTIENAKLKIFNLPIFWIGEVSLNENDSFSMPNLGITNSSLDISYKFKNKTENSLFKVEPIYSDSSLGLSLSFEYDDEKNNLEFDSLTMGDDDSSWAYNLDAQINFNEFISLDIDYSDFSGNSLIQNYGFRYLDLKRRSLDLKQSIDLSMIYENRNFSFSSNSFKNIGSLRPVSHSKDFFLYERFYSVYGWDLEIKSEYAKFKSNVPSSLNMPYQIYDEVDRTVRNIKFNRSFSENKFDHEYEFIGSSREYNIHDSQETLEVSDFSLRQSFALLEDRSLKIGYIWSTFSDQNNLPLLDSYPINPSPESNISLQPWVGNDRDANMRKIFIYKKGMNEFFKYSIATNLYEKYNYDQENMIFKKFFNKKPIFFSLSTNNKNFNIFSMGNYSYEKKKFMGLMGGVRYMDNKTKFSIQKNKIVPSSYPLKSLDNYVMKFKRDFNSFSLFSRAQYAKEDKSLNENIVGVEWKYDCLKLRLSFERAKFFPFLDADYNDVPYAEHIYLTNPKVKNNLSFEFELIGLSNILTPIDNIIEYGLFN